MRSKLSEFILGMAIVAAIVPMAGVACGGNEDGMAAQEAATAAPAARVEAVSVWQDLIVPVVAVLALVLSVVSSIASWRSATASRDSAAIAKATRQPFVDVVDWYNISLEVSEPPQLPYSADRTPDKLTFYGRIQELAGVPTQIRRARMRYTPGIAKGGAYRDIKFLTGIENNNVSSLVLFRERVSARICETFDTNIAFFGLGSHQLPTIVGRIELELTISAVGIKEAYVWNIEAPVFLHGVEEGMYRIELRGQSPVLIDANT